VDWNLHQYYRHPVAVCKIDTSKMSAAVGINEIPGITRYNNFSFDEDGMQV